MIFDAGDLAKAWLSVTEAASKDKYAPPVLNRTVLVEEYRHGIQLVSTDTFMLLRSWVPFQGVDSFSLEAEPPELYELPDRASVVRDPDGRGRQLMGWARTLAGRCQDYDDRPEMRLQIGVKHRTTGAAASFEGMSPTWAKLKLDGEDDRAVPCLRRPKRDRRVRFVRAVRRPGSRGRSSTPHLTSR